MMLLPSLKLHVRFFAKCTVSALWQIPAVFCALNEDAAATLPSPDSTINPGWNHANGDLECATVLCALLRGLVGLAQKMHRPTPLCCYQANV